VKVFRHPSRSCLLRFVSRALILVFVVALLPPAPSHAARDNALAPELTTPDLPPIAATADPHPVLWLVAFVEGEDVQAWFVVPDPELAGNYHRARWMDPNTGRFAGMDPWEGNPYDPPSLHGYLYAANDPANRLDSTGRSTLVSLTFVGAIIGVLATQAIIQTSGVRLTTTEHALLLFAGGALGAALGALYAGATVVAAGGTATAVPEVPQQPCCRKQRPLTGPVPVTSSEQHRAT
jgi:RHS repeat-associated protein